MSIKLSWFGWTLVKSPINLYPPLPPPLHPHPHPQHTRAAPLWCAWEMWILHHLGWADMDYMLTTRGLQTECICPVNDGRALPAIESCDLKKTPNGVPQFSPSWIHPVLAQDTSCYVSHTVEARELGAGGWGQSPVASFVKAALLLSPLTKN